jgi:hypothetical protein
MGKRLLVILTILGVVFIQFASAELTSEQKEQLEKAKKQFEEMQPQRKMNVGSPYVKGNVGKYQAIRLGDDSVFIIDTAEGHFWVWKMEKNKPPDYQGKVSVDK